MNENTKIVFMGTPGFAVPSLQALAAAGYNLAGVVTQPDRPRGRGQKPAPSPVKEAALRLGLEVMQPDSIKDIEFIEKLETLQPQLVVVVAYGRILPARLLELPPFGCINVHASLLPLYRGADPIRWAIFNGERETGVTTMLMNSGLDTGDILLKEKVEIPEEMTYGELHDVLALKGAELLLETVKRRIRGEIEPVSQEGLPASYAPLLKREHELIRWDDPARKIHNQIRGLEPRPGAYTYCGEMALKIRAAKVYRTDGREEEPGTVISYLKGEGIVIQTGQGSLLVTAVQPFGKNIMPADSFVNGYRIKAGYRFANC